MKTRRPRNSSSIQIYVFFTISKIIGHWLSRSEAELSAFRYPAGGFLHVFLNLKKKATLTKADWRTNGRTIEVW